MWWKRYSKKKIQHFFDIRNRSDALTTEGWKFFYDCTYDVLNAYNNHKENLPALNRPKAKIVKLNSDRLTKVLRDINENHRAEG